MSTLDIAAGHGFSEASRVVARARRAGRRRSLLVSVALLVSLAVIFCLTVSIGDFNVPVRDIVPAAFGSADPATVFVVQELRLPRVLTGLLVGAAFGLSGAILQALARNPLASPDILGFSAGAGAAAVFSITVIGGSQAFLPLYAFGGGFGAALLVYALAYRNGVTPYRLILVGIGVAVMFQGLITYMLTRTFIAEAAQSLAWLTGSLNSRTWANVKPLAIAMLILLPAVIALAGRLRTLQLGDDTAKGLGLRVESDRLLLLLVSVALAAAGSAAAGPIAFVAFVAPPIARRLTRASGLTLVPAALTGALLVLVADFAGQHAFGSELPVGIITGLIGGSYLLWLIARINRVGRSA